MFDVGDRVLILATGETGTVVHLFASSDWPYSVQLDNAGDYEDDIDGYLFDATELDLLSMTGR